MVLSFKNRSKNFTHKPSPLSIVSTISDNEDQITVEMIGGLIEGILIKYSEDFKEDIDFMDISPKPSKRVTFSETYTEFETYSKFEYDRKPVRPMINFYEAMKELNDFKRQMVVHPDSRRNTLFYHYIKN